MIVEPSVPITTEYGTSAVWFEAPTSEQWSVGVEPEKTLPAPWWNFFTNLFTKTTVKTRADLTNIVAELNAILALNGTIADPEATTQVSLTIADLLKGQSFAAAVLTNPFTSGKIPRRIGDIAINSTTLEIWQATAITGATGSWTRIAGTQYGGSIIADFDTISVSGAYTSYGTALNAPTDQENFFIQHINSNVGVASAWQNAIGYTTGKLYWRKKISSVWSSWSMGITTAEVDYLSGLTANIKDTFAPLNSPVLTGIPTAPTAAIGTTTTQLATTEFVQQNISSLSMPVGSIYVQYPGKLDPGTLFGGVWDNISSEFAGDFFRAEGGGASAFNSGEQADLVKAHGHGTATTTTPAGSHNHTIVDSSGKTQGYYGLAPGSSGSVAFTNDSNIHTNTVGNHTHTVTVTANVGVENRPKNRTIRIFERTA